MSRRKQIIEGNEVSVMHTFSLGGYGQNVLMEGKRKDLPIVIVLHGGPGTPIPFNAGCRGMFPAFTDNFIMVYWDQLGCGINHRDLDESLTVGSFVTMAKDLIRAVRKLYPENRVYLFSVSWGSVLSGKLLEAGVNVDGVVVYGQVTHDLFFNEPVKKALEESKIPAARLEQIRQMEKQTICNEDLQLLSKSLQKYTDGYFNHNGKRPPMGPMILGMLTSPDYKLRDFKAVVQNGYTRNPNFLLKLWKELLSLDLSAALRKASVPCHILQGETDIVATTEFVQQLVNSAGNSNLTCEIVPDSGHFPNAAAMDRILQALVQISSR